MEAEVAAAQGLLSYGAFIDCGKCYDNIPIDSFLAEGAKHGKLGRIIALAAHQYTGTRRVRWAGALGTGVSPILGIPAGCPLAKGLQHVYLVPAMEKSQITQPQGSPGGWLTPFATSAGIRLASIPEESKVGESDGPCQSQANLDDKRHPKLIKWTKASLRGKGTKSSNLPEKGLDWSASRSPVQVAHHPTGMRYMLTADIAEAWGICEPAVVSHLTATTTGTALEVINLALGSAVMLLMDSQAPRDRIDQVAKRMGIRRETTSSDNRGFLQDGALTGGDTINNPVGGPPSQPWGGATPLGNTDPPPSGHLGTGLEPTPGIRSMEPAPVVTSSCEHQRAGINANLVNAEHYRHMTSREETVKPAKLRTYVDDWRLFMSGNHRAATALVESVVITCHALEDKGMK
eukprot:2191463-Heterocapsa_arctica.AAC.1